MAKEQWHNWGRYILLAIVIVFACGGYALQINTNTSSIEKHDEKIEINKDKIHVLELSDKDIANLAQKGADYMVKIDASLSSLNEKVQEQTTISAVNSEKLKTLTKE